MIRDCFSYIIYKIRSQVKHKKTGADKGRTDNRCIESPDRSGRKGLSKKYFFQKSAICIACILWLITAANVLWRGNNTSGENNIISAFSSNVYSNMESQVTTIGRYGNMVITDTAKEAILKKIAEKIGIDKYTITAASEGDKRTLSLQQDCINGKVIARFITVINDIEENEMNCTQYIYIGVNMSNSVRAAFAYEKIIKELVGQLGLNSTVTVNLKGEIKGNLNTEGKNELTKQMLGEIGAKRQMQEETDDIYTVYAYDKDITDYIKTGSGKVNVNISMSYDKQKDVTNVYFSTPINNQDY